jgi:hypothetical protein
MFAPFRPHALKTIFFGDYRALSSFGRAFESSSFGNVLESSSFGSARESSSSGGALQASSGGKEAAGDLNFALRHNIPKIKRAMILTPSATETPMATFSAVTRPVLDVGLAPLEFGEEIEVEVDGEIDFDGEVELGSTVVVPRNGES